MDACGLGCHLLANPLTVAVISTTAVRRGRHQRVDLCVWVCMHIIVQLSYVVILNYVYSERQDIIKTANMVENYIKLRQDKVDYVLD